MKHSWYNLAIANIYIHTYTQITNTSKKLFNYFVSILLKDVPSNFSSKVENFHCTDDGESSEESHGASNGRQHVHKLCCFIHGDFVKCGGVKIDPYKSHVIDPLIICKFNCLRSRPIYLNVVSQLVSSLVYLVQNLTYLL